MPRIKDPWKAPKDNSWIAVGSKIIPLPPSRITSLFPEGPDWVCKNLPQNPTPYDMPVFVITQILPAPNDNNLIRFEREGNPKVTTTRWSKDILDKWRPAPKPQVLSRKKMKVVSEKPPPTRFEREDVI
jgi:hypothetical protein